MTLVQIDDLESTIQSFPPIDLPTLDQLASLQTRKDRKYLLTPDEVQGALGRTTERLSALEIDGRRTFAYRSLYFDTPEFSSYRSTATGRRRRFKVRLRQYVDQGTTVLEVKTHSPRGETVKHRIAYHSDPPGTLSHHAMGFVDHMTATPGLGASLVPMMWTGYRRSTLVDIDDGSRITIDRDLTAAPFGGDWTSLTDRVIVESKAAGAASPFDRVLWADHLRPLKVSKFASAMALHHDRLPTNKWHRVLSEHFHPVARPA